MPIRILLADDHPLVRAELRALLMAGGDVDVVAEAVDGVSTLSAAAAVTPDIVIMDICMPGMPGVDVAERLAGTVPGIPVLVMSLLADPVVVASMIDAGVRGYVQKDDVFEHLLIAVRALVAGERYFSPALAARIGGDARPIG